MALRSRRRRTSRTRCPGYRPGRRSEVRSAPCRTSGAEQGRIRQGTARGRRGSCSLRHGIGRRQAHQRDVQRIVGRAPPRTAGQLPRAGRGRGPVVAEDQTTIRARFREVPAWVASKLVNVDTAPLAASILSKTFCGALYDLSREEGTAPWDGDIEDRLKIQKAKANSITSICMASAITFAFPRRRSRSQSKSPRKNAAADRRRTSRPRLLKPARSRTSTRNFSAP